MANWNGFFLTEHIEALRQDNIDSKRVAKPIVGEDELAEFNQRVHYAMEYGLPVEVTIWEAGMFTKVFGRVHYVDNIRNQLRVERMDGEGFERVNIADVTAVEVVED
ncbi:YolD-like family protein [Robertmurraya sp. DFI.2.37]|uniref:YolD-like family protein n=1 Tax=Robertmurraya sp. DFI.2.37 TaxID=3031819 RepID=UPI001780C794|nr:YolD-like family protein [Robertmurraya sp. DFI.2.37]MDF1507174.1 YolD-like family protein [Robertmurraya sp. DFI.2.37]